MNYDGFHLGDSFIAGIVASKNCGTVAQLNLGCVELKNLLWLLLFMVKESSLWLRRFARL